MKKSHKNITLESMRVFANKYTERTNTYFCSDLQITASVIKGLAQNKEETGYPLCPCRYYENKIAEADLAYWTCPCVPMIERKECHCMLFLTENSNFSSKNQQISANKLNSFL